MVDFREPIYRTEYQSFTISLYLFGDDHVFFSQICDEQGRPVGAAPKLYESADAAINVCKDLIDFLYGTVDCYQERPEPVSPLAYTKPAGQTMRLVWAN
ncbi:MAG: hypothetical protein GC204_01910 [Chloroflexi bacterium]|nr:hypothetical protein [Chloroflexota bacterium]